MTDSQSLADNAIVVTKLNEANHNSRPEETVMLSKSHWKKINDSQSDKVYSLGKPGLMNFVNPNDFYDNMLAPGKYQLDSLEYSEIINGIINIYDVKGSLLNEVTLDVKPGEIIYIGDILLNRQTNSASLADNHSQAVKWFKHQKPEINKPLAKKLLNGIESNKKLSFKNLIGLAPKQAPEQMSNDFYKQGFKIVAMDGKPYGSRPTK